VGLPQLRLARAWADKKIGPAFNVCTEPIFRDY
jgi:hypothetical protein